MSTEIYLNQLGNPKIAEIKNFNNLPGVGEKIRINTKSYHSSFFEVTDVKKDINNDTIYLYVNPINNTK
ncbi:MAG: hypothetical protein ACOCZT_03415 [Halanaerobiales bacterium]